MQMRFILTIAVLFQVFPVSSISKNQLPFYWASETVFNQDSIIPYDSNVVIPSIDKDGYLVESGTKYSCQILIPDENSKMMQMEIDTNKTYSLQILPMK